MATFSTIQKVLFWFKSPFSSFTYVVQLRAHPLIHAYPKENHMTEWNVRVRLTFMTTWESKYYRVLWFVLSKRRRQAFNKLFITFLIFNTKFKKKSSENFRSKDHEGEIHNIIYKDLSRSIFKTFFMKNDSLV